MLPDVVCELVSLFIVVGPSGHGQALCGGVLRVWEGKIGEFLIGWVGCFHHSEGQVCFPFTGVRV